MNNRHCPQCNFSIFTVRIGKTSSGRQRYRCNNCGKTWTNKERKIREVSRIWDDYVFHNYSVNELALKYCKNEKTIRNILHRYVVQDIVPSGVHDVICMDVTYFGRKWGVLTVLDVYTGSCLYCAKIAGHEKSWDYERAIRYLHRYNVYPKACVIDGAPGVIKMLQEYNILVQYCQFHQQRIVTTCLTRKPILEPNIELRNIALTLPSANYKTFEQMIYAWKLHNEVWLLEKTWYKNENKKSWEYTHKLTRRAINSLINNLPYLFTFEQFPELKIPKTNNKIEAVHSEMKRRLANHRGCGETLKFKMIISFLSRRTEV